MLKFCILFAIVVCVFEHSCTVVSLESEPKPTSKILPSESPSAKSSFVPKKAQIKSAAPLGEQDSARHHGILKPFLGGNGGHQPFPYHPFPFYGSQYTPPIQPPQHPLNFMKPFLKPHRPATIPVITHVPSVPEVQPVPHVPVQSISHFQPVQAIKPPVIKKPVYTISQQVIHMPHLTEEIQYIRRPVISEVSEVVHKPLFTEVQQVLHQPLYIQHIVKKPLYNTVKHELYQSPLHLNPEEYHVIVKPHHQLVQLPPQQVQPVTTEVVQETSHPVNSGSSYGFGSGYGGPDYGILPSGSNYGLESGFSSFGSGSSVGSGYGTGSSYGSGSVYGVTPIFENSHESGVAHTFLTPSPACRDTDCISYSESHPTRSMNLPWDSSPYLRWQYMQENYGPEVAPPHALSPNYPPQEEENSRSRNSEELYLEQPSTDYERQISEEAIEVAKMLMDTPEVKSHMNAIFQKLSERMPADSQPTKGPVKEEMKLNLDEKMKDVISSISTMEPAILEKYEEAIKKRKSELSNTVPRLEDSAAAVPLKSSDSS